MTEVGFSKDREGFFASVPGGRLRLDIRTFSGPEFERVQSILSDTLRHTAALHGPEAGTAGAGAFTPGTLAHWNVHQWEWR